MSNPQYTVWKASTAWNKLAESIDNGTNDPSNPDIQHLFQELTSDLKSSVDDVFLFLERLNQEKEYCKNLVAAVQARKKAIEQAEATLKERISKNLPEKIKGNLGTIYKSEKTALVLERPDVVEEDELLDIDPELVVTKKSYKVDKKAVTSALEAGKELPWAKLEQKQTLVLRKSSILRSKKDLESEQPQLDQPKLLESPPS